ncbi:Multidrug resistance protein MdtC [Paraburkholderia domus]|nr:Multidrug resistance protein MdtC [Paraburkholderia domus]
MPFFFIDRPVFAWIVALAIVVAGALAIPQLPVAQYPRLAPPRIVISATYPGAATEVTDANVGSIIEESLDGADNMLYYETTSTTSAISRSTRPLRRVPILISRWSTSRTG